MPSAPIDAPANSSSNARANSRVTPPNSPPQNPRVSFEFFPPSTVQSSFRLWDCITTLAPMQPRFVSVTYGAGGSTRARTHQAVTAIHTDTDLPVAAHLTCVDQTRAETLGIARAYKSAGINQIVALRGDPPSGNAQFTPHKDGFQSSLELISALKSEGGLTLRVGAYPDVHPQARNAASDLDYLKAKIDAGADEAITQFFFEAETFLRFRDRAAAAGITAPILPGILPIENWQGVAKFAQRCGTPIPAWLSEAFDKATRDDRADLLATALATELCDDLLAEGVGDLHFYTLNKPSLTRDICRALGLPQNSALEKVA